MAEADIATVERGTGLGPRQTAAAIARAIREGVYPAHQALPSYARLAALHGVGVQTVRTAMNLLEAEDLVRRQERRGVFVRGTARLPAGRPTSLRSVTIVGVPERLPVGPVGEWLTGHSLALEQRGLRMRYLAYYGREAEATAEFLAAAAAQGEGYVLLPMPPAALLEELGAHRLPYVVQCYAAYATEGMPPHARIFVNKYKGACEAVEFLLSLGHRRIGFLGCIPSAGASMPEFQIFEGYRSGLLRAGLEPRAHGTAHADTQDPLEAIEPARRILTQGPRPTALLCGNDAAAAGAVKAALALGIRVPEELSVVGFDNAPWLGPVEIPLTTVAIPRRDLGAGAIQLLLDIVAGKAGGEETRVLECDLVVRGTTGPAPRA